MCMEPSLDREREQAHTLVEPLALAPSREEELASETAEALDGAHAPLARGEGIPHQEILREFDLRK
jgi:hypothetical protein